MTRNEIDNASYEDLLRWWRYAPAGQLTAQQKDGDYFAEAMVKAKAKLTPEEQVTISKKIGW